MGGLYGGWVYTVGGSIRLAVYTVGSIRWGVYSVGGLFGGGSIRWVGLYGGIYSVRDLYGGGSIRWGILFFSLSGILA